MALSDYDNSTTYTFLNARVITSGEWMAPAEDEWVAFGGQLGITTSNYSGYGLKDKYWSCSSFNNIVGYYVNFRDGQITYGYGNTYPVRLVRTF